MLNKNNKHNNVVFNQITRYDLYNQHTYSIDQNCQLFILKLLRHGARLKATNMVLKSLCYIKAMGEVATRKFKRHLSEFSFNWLLDILSNSYQIYLTKDYKVVTKQRLFFFVFLKKNGRKKEVFRWLHFLSYLQWGGTKVLNLSWLLFDIYYYNQYSEIFSINNNILVEYKPKTALKKKTYATNRYLAHVIKL